MSNFRPFEVASTARPDGSTLLAWPPEALSLQAGPAHADAPTTTQVPNVTDWMAVWAALRPEQACLAERDATGAWRVVNYREAWRGVQAIAVALLAGWGEHDAQGARRRQGEPGVHDANGAHAGHAVAAPVLAIASPNSVRQALLTFAALHIGVPVAPISPAYASSAGEPVRLALALAALKPRWVYSENPVITARSLNALGVPADQRLCAADLDAWMAEPPISSTELQAAHAAACGGAPAKIMFTSGSTGTPRGVLMSHAMLAAAQATSAAAMRHLPAQAPVYLEWLPWHHVMGGNISLHRLLRFGGTAYLDAGKPVAGAFERTLANLREIAPSFYFSVPLGYALLVPALERDDALARHFFSRLEYLSYGGAALPAELIDRLEQLALRHAGRRIPVTSGYGATETCGPALSTPWQGGPAGALGLPAPGMTAKLVPLGDHFELRLAGVNLGPVYLDDVPASAAAVDDEGFYRTGDAVRWADPSSTSAGLAFAGRVSEAFKLLSGTWVNAGALRVRLLGALAPLVNDLVITGHDREQIGAMAFVNEAACRSVLAAAPTTAMELALPLAQLVSHPLLLEELARRLRAFNRDSAASSECVRRALLLAEPPVAEAFEITDKGYVNQRAVLQRRAAWVERLYSTPVANGVVTV